MNWRSAFPDWHITIEELIAASVGTLRFEGHRPGNATICVEQPGSLSKVDLWAPAKTCSGMWGGQ